LNAARSACHAEQHRHVCCRRLTRHGVPSADEIVKSKSEWGIANGYEFFDSTHYRRNKRDWPGGSE